MRKKNIKVLKQTERYSMANLIVVVVFPAFVLASLVAAAVT